jgi:hypothetical protein
MNTWSDPFDSKIQKKKPSQIILKNLLQVSYFDYLVMQDVFILFEFEN